MAAPLLALLLASAALAAPPTATLRVDLEIFSVPEKQALALIPRLSEDRAAPAAYGELLQGCARGSAQRLDTLTALAAAGDRTTADDFLEQPYLDRFQTIDPRVAALAASTPGHPLSLLLFSGDFQRRNTGVTMALEWGGDTLPGGALVNLDVSKTSLDGWDRFEASREASGTLRCFQTPIFRVTHVGGDLPLSLDVPRLLASHKLPGAANSFELYVATAHLRRFQPSPPAPKLPPERVPVRVEWQRFRLPELDALSLRPRLLDPAQAEAARSEVMALVASGQATLQEWNSFPTVTPQRFYTGSVRERLYGEEIPVAGVPQGAEPFSPPILPLTIPPYLETRNTGDTLEAEVTAAPDRQSFTAALQVSHVDHDGFVRWGFGPDSFGAASFVYQPEFKSKSTTTTFQILNGASTLVGFHHLLESEDQCEITLLRVTAIAPISAKPNHAP